jgi:hypothetical protein
MIYCGSCSGSFVGKFWFRVPDPVSVLAPFPVPAPGFGTGSRFILHSFTTTRFAFLMLEAALFTRKLASNL